MSDYTENYHDLGLHRVIEPEFALPQAAQTLDVSGPAAPNEVEIAVQTLNVDSASFHQIIGEVGRDEEKVGQRIAEIVGQRGKMQNPVTGSGGMLLGEVISVGEHYEGPVPLSPGDMVASLVSLTLTPLRLERIKKVHLDADQVDVEATAYLWPSSPIVVMPKDLEPRLALSSLDVCGAPAQTMRLVQGAKDVLILGMGKSGMLCAAAARDALGKDVRILAIDLHDNNMTTLQEAGIIDDFRTGNAKNPVQILSLVEEMTGGKLCELVVNTCNIEGTEMSAILPCEDRGKVYFFNMATSFARAALGCEGVGKDVDLYIGNGYARDHAEITLDLVRRYDVVRQQIERLM